MEYPEKKTLSFCNNQRAGIWTGSSDLACLRDRSIIRDESRGFHIIAWYNRRILPGKI